MILFLEPTITLEGVKKDISCLLLLMKFICQRILFLFLEFANIFYRKSTCDNFWDTIGSIYHNYGLKF
jgi:hypothetical protein